MAILTVSMFAILVSTAGLGVAADASSAEPPETDNFEDAIWVTHEPPLGPAIDVKSTTTAATMQEGEPTPACGADTLGRSVWYKYRPSQNALVQADTIGSNFDTVIGVWKGSSLSDLTEYACNDDQAGRSNSVSIFEAVSGTTYYIQVGGYDAKGGELNFNLGLARVGAITGTISDSVGPLRRACVGAYLVGNVEAPPVLAETTALGSYALTGLVSGAWQLSVYDCDGRFDHASEWFDDKETREASDEVLVSGASPTRGVDAELTALRLALKKLGAGDGTVVSDPAGIDCGEDCDETFVHGDFPTQVTLTADPAANALFAGWDGCDAIAAGACQVTMNDAKNVEAFFDLRKRALNVLHAGAGEGRVTGTGIDCGHGGSDCAEEFEDGRTVTLEATPAASSVLAGWEGCDTSDGAACTVDMKGAKAVTATFDIAQRELSVSTAGTGTGRVTANGIDCGSSSTDCDQAYDHGTAVTLTAQPDAASYLAEWSGCDTVVSNLQCRVTMQAARSVTATFELDTTPPDTSITAGPASQSPSASAEFRFSSTKAGSTFACSLDGGVLHACSSPAVYTGLAEGAHTFSVRATDQLGTVDPTPAERAWTVDLTAPDTTIASAPTARSAASNSTFTFDSSEPGVTFRCSLDGAAFTACTSPKSYGLAEGPHTFRVRATDVAGNEDASPAEFTWTVDRTAPNTTLLSGPSGKVASPQATFTFGSTEPPGTFTCSLDGSAFAACKSPATYVDLAEGSHTFRVRAIDEAGNIDGTPAERKWTIDGNKPVVTVTSGPPSITTSTSATIRFESNEDGSTLYCSLDSGGLSVCSSPISFANLSEGPHSFRVFAVDAAGNEGVPAVHQWTVDAQAPVVTVQRPTGGIYVNDQAVGTGPANVVVGSVKVQVEAIDAESGVSSFRFDVNGTAVEASQVTRQGNIFSFTFRPTAPGPHTIGVQATNGSGLTRTTSIEVYGIPV